MKGEFRSIHAAAAEYFVLAELLRNHKEAYLAQGTTQPDWDIICIENNAFLKIQVKALDFPAYSAVNMKSSTQCDYLVVVFLNRGDEKPSYYIFANKEVQALLSAVNEDRKDKKQTISFSAKRIKALSKFHNNWWFKLN